MIGKIHKYLCIIVQTQCMVLFRLIIEACGRVDEEDHVKKKPGEDKRSFLECSITISNHRGPLSISGALTLADAYAMILES